MALIIIGLVLWMLQLLSWLGTWMKFEHGSYSMFGGFGASLYGNTYLISILIGSSLAAILGAILILIGVALINRKSRKKELLRLNPNSYFSYPGEVYAPVQSRQKNKKTPLLIASIVFAVYFIYRLYMNYRTLINAISEYQNDGYWRGFPTPDINKQFFIILLEMLMILTLFISSVLLYRSKPFYAIRNYLLISVISGILSIFLIEFITDIPIYIQTLMHFGFETFALDIKYLILNWPYLFLNFGVCIFVYIFQNTLSIVFLAKSNHLLDNSVFLNDKGEMRSLKGFAVVLFGLAIIVDLLNIVWFADDHYFITNTIYYFLRVSYPAMLLITTLYIIKTKKFQKIKILMITTFIIYIVKLLYTILSNFIIEMINDSFIFNDILNYIPVRELFWIAIFIIVYYIPHKISIPAMQAPAISNDNPYQITNPPGICWNCGRELSIGAAFCENCGTAVHQQYEVSNANTVAFVYSDQQSDPRY